MAEAEVQTEENNSSEVSEATLRAIQLKHRSITVKITHEMFEELKYHATMLEHSLAQLTIRLLEGYLAKEKEKAEQNRAEKKGKTKKKA
ncbi:MAG: hypothetical protein HQ517_04905 [SAR324 cluster bacterium]|nr:hypothetical protein [SAR324 cluster bacterium]